MTSFSGTKMSCFICGNEVPGKGFYISDVSTTFLSVPFPDKVCEIVGNKFLVVVSQNDKICDKCFILVNHVDELEHNLLVAKQEVFELLRTKYNLHLDIVQEKKLTDYLSTKLKKKDLESTNASFDHSYIVNNKNTNSVDGNDDGKRTEICVFTEVFDDSSNFSSGQQVLDVTVPVVKIETSSELLEEYAEEDEGSESQDHTMVSGVKVDATEMIVSVNELNDSLNFSSEKSNMSPEVEGVKGSVITRSRDNTAKVRFSPRIKVKRDNERDEYDGCFLKPKPKKSKNISTDRVINSNLKDSATEMIVSVNELNDSLNFSSEPVIDDRRKRKTSSVSKEFENIVKGAINDSLEDEENNISVEKDIEDENNYDDEGVEINLALDSEEEDGAEVIQFDLDTTKEEPTGIKEGADQEGEVSFSMFSSFSTHIRNLGQSNEIKCSSCDFECRTKLEYARHIIAKHGILKSFACTLCDEKFATNKALKFHGQKAHPGDQKYVCSECGQSFKRKVRLDNHKLYSHGDQKCKVCGKFIGNWIKLRQHERRHAREDFKAHVCDVCQRPFKSNCGLERHKVSHTGKYKLFCEVCNRGFMSPSILEEHRGVHTQEQRYLCEICNRRFVSKSTLQLHKQWHKNPLPFQCSMCDKKFKYRSVRAVHVRREHTGEQPYECCYCDSKFLTSGTLNKHMKIHTRDYPYNCYVCERGFIQRRELAKHLHKMHDDKSLLISTPLRKCLYKVALRPDEQP